MELTTEELKFVLGVLSKMPIQVNGWKEAEKSAKQCEAWASCGKKMTEELKRRLEGKKDEKKPNSADNIVDSGNADRVRDAGKASTDEAEGGEGS